MSTGVLISPRHRRRMKRSSFKALGGLGQARWRWTSTRDVNALCWAI
ncbi:hypothetical protein EDD27_3965 [Nonomuraea polychroma]|uniref:Uncharacterized protein n=1 Tax=Nonomuraea polychroma TaxID=46176 RepID=A0A438M6T9_9ACTN|nr:hypothetical protein EDD27_3965 [Nonomuraea polychroma]